MKSIFVELFHKFCTGASWAKENRSAPFTRKQQSPPQTVCVCVSQRVEPRESDWLPHKALLSVEIVEAIYPTSASVINDLSISPQSPGSPTQPVDKSVIILLPPIYSNARNMEWVWSNKDSARWTGTRTGVCVCVYAVQCFVDTRYASLYVELVRVHVLWTRKSNDNRGVWAAVWLWLP
jgi:hypothetical protein